MGDRLTNDFARSVVHGFAFGLGFAVATAPGQGEDKPIGIACGGTPERPAPGSASVRLRIVEGF